MVPGHDSNYCLLRHQPVCAGFQDLLCPPGRSGYSWVPAGDGWWPRTGWTWSYRRFPAMSTRKSADLFAIRDFEDGSHSGRGFTQLKRPVQDKASSVSVSFLLQVSIISDEQLCHQCLYDINRQLSPARQTHRSNRQCLHADEPPAIYPIYRWTRRPKRQQ